jgi:tetratricopeptide (TPR) repeat protein
MALNSMRSSTKAACGFISLIVASGIAASSSPAGPNKKIKRAPVASTRHADISQVAHTDTLPVTTSSSQARTLYEAGIQAWEAVQIDSALKRWRTAINVDPHFALAHLFLSYCTTDPVEEQTERQKAKFLANKVTPAEQSLIAWLSGVRENDYLASIVAMNDLLQQYPKDKQLHLWAASWLFREKEYELAQKRLEEAVAIDRDFAPALNYLGYVYAYQGDYKQAVSVMQHYVELLPNEPNPQDSYAEILRMAGRYQDALEHYRVALRIDPNFHSSQLGIADTYSLMGQQKKAREEYFNARVLATDKVSELQDLLQSAFTYVRDRDFVGADQAFEEVAQQARLASLPVIEGEAWRMRARLQFITTSGDLIGIVSSHTGKHFALIHKKHLQRPELEYLARADKVLKEARTISESDRQQEYALILRERAEAAGRRGAFAEADAAVAQLEAMTSDGPSPAVQHALNGAKGAVLLYEGNYAQAVPLLERDNDNAFSLFRLAYAEQKNGTAELAPARLAPARAFNEPTAEQAFCSSTDPTR